MRKTTIPLIKEVDSMEKLKNKLAMGKGKRKVGPGGLKQRDEDGGGGGGGERGHLIELGE